MTNEFLVRFYPILSFTSKVVYSCGIGFMKHGLSDFEKKKVGKSHFFGITSTILEIIRYNFFFWSKFDGKAFSGVGFDITIPNLVLS